MTGIVLASTRPTLGSRERHVRELLSGNKVSVSYGWLRALWHRSVRNGQWTRLSLTKRGLFRCALWIAKARGSISNMRLMVQVLRIALELLNSLQSRIVSAGRKRAMVLFETYRQPGGVFSWAPRMREWLHDPKYILYLGLILMRRGDPHDEIGTQPVAARVFFSIDWRGLGFGARSDLMRDQPIGCSSRKAAAIF
jgi:hypothetical protein